MSNSYNRHVVQHGNYDWLHPNETQTQYIFYLRDDAPFERKSFGVVVTNLAEDFDTVYECAEALLGAVAEYGYHPDKAKVEKLVEYLYPYLFLDKLEALKEERSDLLLRVRNVDHAIASAESEQYEFQSKLKAMKHD